MAGLSDENEVADCTSRVEMGTSRTQDMTGSPLCAPSVVPLIILSRGGWVEGGFWWKEGGELGWCEGGGRERWRVWPPVCQPLFLTA